MNKNYNNNSLTKSNYSNTNNYNLYRSKLCTNKDQKKLNFKTLKDNTIASLNDVEHFLNNFQQAIRYIKLYKLLK